MVMFGMILNSMKHAEFPFLLVLAGLISKGEVRRWFNVHVNEENFQIWSSWGLWVNDGFGAVQKLHCSQEYCLHIS